MIDSYEVHLWEDKIEQNETGKITHHPLSGLYLNHNRTSGYLTFCGDGLEKSKMLDDIRVFHLWFYGEPDVGQPDYDDQDRWADPLRLEALQRLLYKDWNWYLSPPGWMFDTLTIEGYLQTKEELEQGLLQGEQLNFSVIQSLDYGRPYERLVYEIPKTALPYAVLCFWQMAILGVPIEGYLMPLGQMETLRGWDNRPKDDRLFREVMDSVFTAFYTFPAEHRHIVFVTNKMSLDDLQKRLNIEDLQIKATEIGDRISNKS